MNEALKKQLSIASELKAPKSQYNSFGKYYYRSREDILEAVKPLLVKNQCALLESDEIVVMGERYYVKAKAMLVDLDSGDSCETIGWAREDYEKKGMDGSQITGTASSYARKYALNALFLIDDTKDADTDEYRRQNSKPKEPSFMELFEEVRSLHDVTSDYLQERIKLTLGLDPKEKLPKAKVKDAVGLLSAMKASGTLNVSFE
jgi:hypothetical protein